MTDTETVAMIAAIVDPIYSATEFDLPTRVGWLARDLVKTEAALDAARKGRQYAEARLKIEERRHALHIETLLDSIEAMS